MRFMSYFLTSITAWDIQDGRLSRSCKHSDLPPASTLVILINFSWKFDQFEVFSINFTLYLITVLPLASVIIIGVWGGTLKKGFWKSFNSSLLVVAFNSELNKSSLSTACGFSSFKTI